MAGGNVFSVDCVCTGNVVAGLPVCNLDLGLVVPEFLSVTSKGLVFVVPATHMSVYSQLHSALYIGLCMYEGWRVEMFSPKIVFVPKMWACDSRFVI